MTLNRSASPLWKQLFDAVDQRLSPTLNDFAKRDEVVSLTSLALRSRAEIDIAIERLSRRALHFLNLPAGSDVNRLLEHIARVEREVRDLRHQLTDRENAEYLAALARTHAQRTDADKPTTGTTASTSERAH
jgi:hypothetical protein